jgi:hypothetical protein
MKRALFSGAAMLMAVSSTAFAQSKPIVAGAGLSPDMTNDGTNTPSPAAPAPKTAATPDAKASNMSGLAPGNPGSPAEAAAAATGDASGGGTGLKVAGKPTGTIQQQLTADLKKAGFTDVSIKPGSLIVQAKDGSGDPVTLILAPDSISVFSVADSSDPTKQTQPDPAAQTPQASVDPTTNKPPTNPTGLFVSIPGGSDLTSQIVGLDIYNASKQDIGTIKDIALGAHGVKAYIVGVGGVLGMGDHFVAVSPSALKLTYNASEKKWHAAMETNAAQLKAAPEYKYPTSS